MAGTECSVRKRKTVYNMLSDSDDDVFSSDDSVRDPDYINESCNTTETLVNLTEVRRHDC